MVINYGGNRIDLSMQPEETLQEIKRSAKDHFYTAGRTKNPSQKTSDTMDFLSEVIQECDTLLESRKKRAA